MKIQTYPDAESFLSHTRPALESNEAANGLMLGVCQRQVRHPERIEAAPCLKTVTEKGGLVLAAMMTPPHNLVVYGHRGDLDRGAELLSENLIAENWYIPGVMGPSQVAKTVVSRLGRDTGRRYRHLVRLKVYELRKLKIQSPEQGHLRAATEQDLDLVARWWSGFQMDIHGKADLKGAERQARTRIGDEDVFLWVDGQPVSLAAKNRPTRTGISVGPVYTPPEFRQRGYATACVAELSRLLLAEGRKFCVLFADVANAPATSLYPRIGYRPVCDYDDYRLG